MKTFKSLLALLGASSLLFGGEAFSFETRAGESGSRNASSLVEGREGTVRGRYRGYFASMPAGTYPKVNWELVKTKPSARTYYVPTQALAITVPLKAGTYNGHGLQFAIPIAANNAMVRVMARFDFDGSGTTDRMEMYYPTVVDGLAILTHATGIEGNRSYGHYPTQVSDGVVTLFVWVPEGVESATVMTGQAFVKAPFDGNGEVRLSKINDDDVATITPASSGLMRLALKGTGNGLFAAAVEPSGVNTPWLGPDGKKPPESDFFVTL